METQSSQKTCPGCNGIVPTEATQCLYCGCDLSKQNHYTSPEAEYKERQSLEDSLYSVYKPPYPSSEALSAPTEETKEAIEECAPPPSEQLEKPTFIQAEKTQNDTPFQGSGFGGYTPETHTMGSDAALAETTEKGSGSIILPFVLLTSGLNLLLFSLFLAIFQKGGTLTLQWSSSLWPVLLVLSLPVLFLGYKRASST